VSPENVEVVERLQRDNDTLFSFYDAAIEWDMSRSAFPLPGEESVDHGLVRERRHASAEILRPCLT
jgi:hypothetical protein